MDKVCAGLAIICAVFAVACFGGVLWFVYAVPGVILGQVADQAAQTGSLPVSAALAMAALCAAVVSLRRTTRMAGYILWLISGAALGCSAVQAVRLLVRVQTVTRNVGGLSFAVRAPAYADVLMILAGGLATGAVAFGVLAWLETRAAKGRAAAQRP